MTFIYSLLFVVFTFLYLFLIKKDIRRWIYAPIMGGATVIFVIILNLFIVFPADTVTIRALDEKDSSSAATYITMQNITDNNDTVLKYSVVDGKWLDTNGGQRWGGVSVTGLTDTITIKLRKGNDRSINFHATRWGGKAALSFNGSSEKVLSSYVDSDNDSVSIPLPNTGGIIGFGIINIFAIVLECIILGIVIFCLYIHRIKILNLITEHQYELVAIVIALVGFTIMISLGNYKSTWMDDSATMGIAAKNRSLGEVIELILREESTTPPLYTVAWHYFSKLIPVGTGALALWARMLSIIANTIGFYVGAMVVRRGWNKYVGIIFELFLITSNALIVNSGFAVRSYGFMILMPLFLLYAIILRLEDGKENKTKTTVVHISAILAICYTHYFGILTCFGLFLYECYLFIKKRYSYKFIFSYMVAGAVYLPWLIINYLITREQWGNAFWISPPTFGSIIDILNWLVSSQEFAILCVMIGFFVTIYRVREAKLCIDLNLAMIITIIVEIFIVFFYSKYLNPKSSVWTNRYFLNLVPYMLLIARCGLEEIISFFTNGRIKRIGFVYLVMSCFIFINSNVTLYTKRDMESSFYQPYREAAEYLINQPDANSPDTLVLISSTYSIGWDYYLTHNGKFEPIKYQKTFQGDFDRENIKKYKKIYLLDIHILLNDADRMALEENFHQIYKDEKSTVTTYIRN